MMGGNPGWFVCKTCGGSLGVVGGHTCQMAAPTDTARDDAVIERCDAWDEEDAITAIKYLAAKWKIRDGWGGGLDGRHADLRHKRHLAEKT